MMNHWFWENGIPKELCEIVLKEKNNLLAVKSNIGDIIGNIDDKELDEKIKEVRDSTVYWLPRNHWIEGILFNYSRYANLTAGWNFKISEPEFIQLAEYDKNGHYDWHEDWNPLSDEPFVRKVSTVCLLNDPTEFEGGEFELEDYGIISLKQGSVISFPSFIKHRVRPVTSGIRMSAVCWILGDKTL